jgi:hypothetical protein
LLSISDANERDLASISILVGTKATSIAVSRTSRPSVSSTVRPSRTLATVPVPTIAGLQDSFAFASGVKSVGCAMERIATHVANDMYFGKSLNPQ